MNDSLRFLLDTNVVSELTRKRPDRQVLEFFAEIEPESMSISALTLGEIRKGIVVRARTDPAAAHSLEQWVELLEHTYSSRILPVESSIAHIWGKLSADRPRHIVDTLLAATALHHGLILVTRNVIDLAGTGVPVINPWELPQEPMLS